MMIGGFEGCRVDELSGTKGEYLGMVGGQIGNLLYMISVYSGYYILLLIKCIHHILIKFGLITCRI